MPFSFRFGLEHIVGTPGFCTDPWVLHTACIPIIIEAESLKRGPAGFFFSLCFLAIYFLGLVPHVSFVPVTFLGSDIHVTVSLLSISLLLSTFMGSYL